MKPKVLIVASWYPRPEYEFHGIFIQEQAEALAAACDVAVLHLLVGGDPMVPTVTREAGVSVVRGSLPLPKNPSTRIDHLRTLWSLTIGYRRRAKELQAALASEWGAPDIVHAHAAFPAAIGAQMIASRIRCPYLVTEHQAEYLLESPGFRREGGRLLPALARRAIQRADAFIAVSQHLADAISAAGYYSHPVVIPNLVSDLDTLSFAPHSNELRVPRMVHVSLMRAYEKNIPMLLEALSLVDKRGQEYSFTFVGDGPDRESMELLASQLGLIGRRVKFVGPKSRSEVLGLLRDADFSVVSSRYETFGLAAAESLAVGRPVVSTRCGGPEEFIDDTVGLLVENDDSAALADGICLMIEKSGTYDASQLHQHVQVRFSPHVVVKQLVELYQQLIGACPLGTRSKR